MPMKRNKYPDDWEAIAANAKANVKYRCERCGKKDSKNPRDGNCLTVHHLVPRPQLCEAWNLAVLCQRCHLRLQKIDLFQEMFGWFKHTPWFMPHLKGFQKWLKTKEFPDGK